MVSPYLQIADVAANSNNQSTQANNQTASLDGAINAPITKAITGDTSFTTAETRENGHIELTGTPGAPHNIDMPDTFARTLMVTNSTDDQMTIRNSASGGTGNPVLAVNDTVLFNYDGTNFKSVSGGGGGGGTFLGLTDTPSSYTGETGKVPTVRTGALVFEPKATGSTGAFHTIQTISGAETNYDFSFPIGSTFDSFMLIGWVQPSDDAVDMEFVVSDDDFVSVEEAGSDYTWTNHGLSTDTTIVSDESTGDNQVRWVNSAGNAADERISFQCRISEPLNASEETFFTGDATYATNTPAYPTYFSGGRFVTASALTGVRIRFSAGTIAAGSVSLVGITREISIPANGAMKAIETQVLTSGTTADFVFPAGFRDYVLKGWIRGSLDNANGLGPALRVSTDGGSTFVSTGTPYSHANSILSDGGGVGSNSSSAANQILIDDEVGTAAGEGIAFEIHITAPADTDVFTFLHWNSNKLDKDGPMVAGFGGGSYKVTTAVDAIRLLWTDASTFEGGTVTLYGILSEPDGDTTPELILTHEETSGTAGGGSTASSFVKRTLLTEKKNTITGASHATSVITLPAGTYEFESWTHSFQNGHTKDRLRNTTDSTTPIVGGSGRNPTTTNDVSHPTLTNGQFTITASKDFELQTYSELTKATDGFGTAVTSGEVEVYAYVKFRKIG